MALVPDVVSAQALRSPMVSADAARLAPASPPVWAHAGVLSLSAALEPPQDVSPAPETEYDGVPEMEKGVYNHSRLCCCYRGDDISRYHRQG